MRSKILYLFLVSLLVLPSTISIVFADTASELQQKIDDRNAKIKQLEQEITQYNQKVTEVGTQAKTLQSTIKVLDLTQKKISSDISLTQQKITKTDLTIEQLGDQIDDTAQKIQDNKDAIAHILRSTQVAEDTNPVALILAAHTVSEMWDNVETMRQVQSKVKAKSDELRGLKIDLEDKQSKVSDQKNQLVDLKQDLSGKKSAVESTKQEQANLLAQTKKSEAAYKTLIKTTEAQKAQFEKEVFDYESQLHLSIDKNGYPTGAHGILSWPLDKVIITQKFGKTVGAEKLYTSGSHNGVDFGASIGTRVKNVLSGVVVGTGNTDQYPGCYSFGKWVMVKHENGLSTIYGHLSVISTTVGQKLDTGDLIGFSGNTGYSTGPHLHISVYATQGVRIEQFVNSKGCKQATIPLADVKAYLDPLAYFPSL
ncbi:MAG: peptidoglycan DD-metalloendopeptidase family protein [Patescibacteria group bacterium]